MPKIGPVFVTREQITEQKDNSLYADDLRAKRLVHATIVTPESRSRVIPYWGYYAVTAEDIARMQGTFPRHSFVFANACSSFANDRMARAFQQKGVSAYAGWDNTAYIPGSPQTALWVFDFLTGSYLFGSPNLHTDLNPNVGGDNKLPMNLKNAVTATKREMSYWPPASQPRANLRINGNMGFVLEFAPMPHLDSYEYEGGNTLILKGSFGTQRGKVTVGEISFQILSWTESEIRCKVSKGILENVTAYDKLIALADKLKSNPLPFVAVRVSVQRYYSDTYYLGINGYGGITSLHISGPYITSQWQHPQAIGHVVVNLSQRPSVGDRYTLTNYSNGTSAVTTYCVCGVNDNFAWITFPPNGSTITTTRPTFTWQPASNVESYCLLLSDSAGRWIWSYWPPVGATSAVCGVTLQHNQTYTLHLHTFDANYNQATTSSTFKVE